MVKITSLTNQVVKEAVGLRDAKTRRQRGLTLIDGLREISRALKAKVPLSQVFFCPALYHHQREEELVAQCIAHGAKPIEVTKAVYDKISFGERHEGLLVVAKVESRALSQLKLPAKPFIVVVEAIEKPGNLGALLRTCDGAGVDALIVCDPKTDIYNPNVIRASIGCVFTVPLAVGTPDAVLALLKTSMVKICGAFVNGKSIYTQTDLRGGLAVVLGCEDEGLSDFWAQHVTLKITIPMLGAADSLNVATSGAVIIYEALRQRGAG